MFLRLLTRFLPGMLLDGYIRSPEECLMPNFVYHFTFGRTMSIQIIGGAGFVGSKLSQRPQTQKKFEILI